jgi:hypothetical protein
MLNRPRQRLLIDRHVQGALISRVVLYWFLCVTGMFCLLAGFPLVTSFFMRSPGTPSAWQIVVQTWRMFWPAVFASALMLPWLILDVIRISHRFVGPLYRLRTSLRDMAEGKQVAAVKFRAHDFWFELAEDFNRAVARVRQDAAASRATSETRADTTQPAASV